MEMEMQMKSYLKDGNVGSVVGVVTPTDSNVGVGVGVVTPNSTANHELAAQPLLKLRVAALFFKAAYQFMEAKGSWEMNEINTTEEAIPTRYYCYRCRHLVTVDVEVEIKCPFCQDGFIQPCEGVNSRYLTMSSESELSESGSDGEGLVDEQRHVIRVLVLSFSQLVFILGIGRFSVFSCGIEILASVFDQVSSPLNPHYALIGMLLAIVAVLVCICELLQNAIKERVVLRSRGMLWCFHYPTPNNMLFGTFPEIFGLGLAIVQCICSAVQYHFSRRHATSPIKLSPLPVVFAFSLVVSKLLQSRRCTVDDTLQDGTTSGLGHSMTEMRWGGLSIEHPSSSRDYIYRSRITIGKGKQFYTFSVLLRCWLGCITSQPPSLVVSLVTGAVDRVPLLWVRYFGGGLEMDLGLEAADKLRRDKVVAL